MLLAEMASVELDEVGVEPILVRSRSFVGRLLFLRRFSRIKPRKPGLTAREPIALAGYYRGARCRDDVRKLPCRSVRGFEELYPSHALAPFPSSSAFRRRRSFRYSPTA